VGPKGKSNLAALLCPEVPLRTYAHFADRDPLTRLVLEQAQRRA
jgi:hypothetical protein